MHVEKYSLEFPLCAYLLFNVTAQFYLRVCPIVTDSVLLLHDKSFERGMKHIG